MLITNNRHEECIQAIVNAMTNLGVGVEKVQKNHTKIKESEVTKQAFTQIDIEQILANINDYEEEIAAYDLSISTIQTLT